MAPTTPVLSKILNSVHKQVLRKSFSRVTSLKRCCGVVLLLSSLLLISFAWAAGFRVLSADTRLENGIYLLSARIVYRLGDTPQEALENGVPLTIELEMEVIRNREWLWDETIAELEQKFRLEYHTLSRQYLITNLNSGQVNSFPSLATATQFLGRIDDFPLLDASLLESGESYYGQLRVNLDIDDLPVPLQVATYLFGDWQLSSEWYAWPL